VNLEDFRHLRSHLEDRVKAGLRLLEDHGNAVAPDFHHLRLGKLEQVLPLKENFTFHNFTGATHQPQDRDGGDAFAAAGFAHQPQHFARHDVQIQSVHSLHHAVLGEEVRLEITNIEQGLSSRRH